MSTFDDNFQKALRATKRSPVATMRKLAPGARQGKFVVVEDGWLVLYDITTNDFGCQTVARQQTKVRLASSGVDESHFPANVGHDGGGLYMLVGTGPGSKRQVRIRWESLHPATVEKSEIPEKDLAEQEAGRRMIVLKEAVRTAGGRVHDVWLDRGRATKVTMTAFHTLAQMAMAGRTEDEVYDVLVDKIGLEATNDFTAHARFNWRNPRGPHDIYTFSTFASKKALPLAIVGNVPQIDWCNR
jgi:hypothetical protein